MKKARDKANKEETVLRERPGDFMLPTNVFENAVGQFWGLHDTRAYMRARFALADKIVDQFPRSAAAVGAALDHFLGMMRLCHGDNMGLREMAPALMLRLGRDQEAYDFLRWWAVGSDEGDWDWGEDEENGGKPWREEGAAGADALEEPQLWTGDYLGLSHAAAVLLIKIRIYLDLRAVQDAGIGLRGGALTPEATEHVRGHLVDGVFCWRVRGQMDTLIDAINGSNLYLWVTMLHPQEALADPPMPYSPGSVEEAFLMVKYNYRSWEETPGAIEIIKTFS